MVHHSMLLNMNHVVGNYKLCEIDDLAAFADFEINKILTTSDPEYLQEHYQEMMEPFKDSLSCMFTGPFYFEFYGSR